MLKTDSPKVLAIFDIDGTLISSHKHVSKLFSQAFVETTGKTLEFSNFHFAGMTDLGVFKSMLDAAGLVDNIDGRFRDFERCFTGIMRNSYKNYSDPYLLPGVNELLTALSQKDDVILALGTGNCRETSRIKLSSLGLDHYFSIGGFGGEYEKREDVISAAIIEAEKKCNWCGAAWVIGDTVRDIAAARLAGAKAMAVSTGPVQRDDLVAGKPDHLFEDLSDTNAVMKALGVDL